MCPSLMGGRGFLNTLGRLFNFAPPPPRKGSKEIGPYQMGIRFDTALSLCFATCAGEVMAHRWTALQGARLAGFVSGGLPASLRSAKYDGGRIRDRLAVSKPHLAHDNYSQNHSFTNR